MTVVLRKFFLLRGLALAGLLGLVGCGSMPVLGRAEPDSSLRLAGIFMSAGAPDAALRAAEEALSRQPRNAEAMMLRADALAALERMDEAQQAYLAAIAQDPRAVGPRIALGRMLVRTNPPAAEAMFNDVLARQPNNAIALNNLGIARDLQGRHREAQPAYKAARQADPRMTGASVNLGLSLVLSGDMDEAVRELTPLAAAPDAPATVVENLGVALAASGQGAEAARVLARVLAPAEITEVLAQYRGQAPRLVAAPVMAAAPVAVAPVAVAPVVAAPAPVAPVPVAPMPVAPMPVAAMPVAAVPAAAPVPEAPVVAMAPVAMPIAVPVAPGVPAAASVVLASVATPVAAVAAPVARPVVERAAVERAPVERVAVAERAGAGRAAFAQLAASESETAAPEEWERLRRRLGGLLQARETLIVPAEVGGRTVWRLRSPFGSTAEAASFCAEVRAAGGGCWAAVGG